jgi:hypothetical protein
MAADVFTGRFTRLGTRSPSSLRVNDGQHLLTISILWWWTASARKHDVPDEEILHALRHHWRAFETDDPAVTMFIGPSRSGEPLEVGVVTDEDGSAVIHAMRACGKFLKGWWTE